MRIRLQRWRLWRLLKQTAISLTKRTRASVFAVSAATALIGSLDAGYSKIRESLIARDSQVAVRWLAHRSAGRQTAPFSVEVGGELFANEPTNEAILAAVRDARSHDEDTAFVILQQKNKIFIQAAVVQKGWELEYSAPYMEKAGRRSILFACQSPVDTSTVIKSMTLYRRGDASWASACPWVRDGSLIS